MLVLVLVLAHALCRAAAAESGESEIMVRSIMGLVKVLKSFAPCFKM